MGGLDSAKKSIGHLRARHPNIKTDELRYNGFRYIQLLFQARLLILLSGVHRLIHLYRLHV